MGKGKTQVQKAPKEVTPACPDHLEIWKKISGTTNTDFTTSLINQTLQATWVFSDDDEEKRAESKKRGKANLVAFEQIGPKDGLEAMLAAQMIATHNVGMEFLRRTMLPDQALEGINTATNRATKLLRLFHLQMEALEQYRGRGDVKVGNVNVNDGGQAIVGNVTNEKSKT